MLDVRRLRVLRSVVNSGSISAAAVNLGYTPSAISQQIAALEKEAGTALLEKVGRGVRLPHLLDAPYLVVLPRDHRLAGSDPVDLTELADEPWIDNEFPPGICRQIMLDGFAAAGFSPNFVVEADDYPTAQGFVAAGV